MGFIFKFSKHFTIMDIEKIITQFKKLQELKGMKKNDK